MGRIMTNNAGVEIAVGKYATVRQGKLRWGGIVRGFERTSATPSFIGPILEGKGQMAIVHPDDVIRVDAPRRRRFRKRDVPTLGRR